MGVTVHHRQLKNRKNEKDLRVEHYTTDKLKYKSKLIELWV